MAGLGMESVSFVAGGVVIGWGLSELARRWDWGGGDWWVIGGAAFGLASGMSQLIRGALKLNTQLDRAAAARKGGEAPSGDGGDRTGGGASEP